MTNVSGKRELKSVTDLLDNLDRMREAGIEVHDISRAGAAQDTFQITFTKGGAREVGEFTLPPKDADFVSRAITAGFFSAQAVNSGNIGEVLLNFAAAMTGPLTLSTPLRVGGAGTHE